MRAMERVPEWREYDAHVTYELDMLRARYAASGEAMTPTRRAQMAAHLKAKQREVMEKHAEAAAERYMASLSPQQVEALRAQLRRVDASVPEDVPTTTKPGGESMFDKELKDALWELSSMMAAAQAAAKSKGGGDGGKGGGGGGAGRGGNGQR